MAFNPDCPHCGEGNILRGSVTMRASEAPLYADGFDPTDGIVGDNEVTDISCGRCGAEVLVEHYLEHGEDECDCRSLSTASEEAKTNEV